MECCEKGRKAGKPIPTTIMGTIYEIKVLLQFTWISLVIDHWKPIISDLRSVDLLRSGPCFGRTQLRVMFDRKKEYSANASYKSQKDGDKYVELKVIFFYHDTKPIELNINFISSVFVVKGENFTNWVDNEFPKLLGNHPTIQKAKHVR